MAGRSRFNRKRRIVVPVPEKGFLEELSVKVHYVGSPYHKRGPGDFKLTPPAQPRPDKTLCDAVGIDRRSEAEKWLKEGILRGMISPIMQDGFPKHVWAVTDDGVVLEASYNNEGPGNYHGYPLFKPDPFRQIVLKSWHEA